MFIGYIHVIFNSRYIVVKIYICKIYLFTLVHTDLRPASFYLLEANEHKSNKLKKKEDEVDRP